AVKWPAMRWIAAGVVTGSPWGPAPNSPSPGSRAGWELPKAGGITTGYRTPRVAGVYLEDSVRLQSLFRDGKTYLSLHDAISLALENNLDLELERYGIRLADSDVLRSQAGALPRGVPLSIRESVAGLGTPVVGPNGTLG